MLPEQVKKLWADPRFDILMEVDKVLDSSKIWGGMEWVYHPIHPVKYRALAKRVRTEINKLKQEYGVSDDSTN